MGIFEKNMEYITNANKTLVKELEHADRNSFLNSVDNIKSMETKTDISALVINYKSKEYRINSLYNPIVEAEKWAEQYKFESMNMVISMFGFGNGTFVREILQRMKEGDKLLVKEPSADIFLYVLKHYDITDIMARENVFIGVEGFCDFEFHNLQKSFLDITNLRTQINCIHPQYDKIFPESCMKFFKELKDNCFRTILYANTAIFFGKTYIENIIYNLRYIRNSSNLYDLKCAMGQNTTAIIVAAGPSVEYNIEGLKRAKGKTIIFAVDRVLDYLLDNGVIPDFIATLDAQKTLEFFTKREDIEIPLICAYNSSIEIMKRHKGKKIIGRLNPFERFLYERLDKRISSVNPGGSVGTFLFSVCMEVGFKRIVFVGKDMAYNGENTHVGNVAEKLTGKQLDAMVEGIDGKMVHSRSDWKEYSSWINDKIQSSTKKLEIYDTKKSGAKIKGAIVMPLNEILDLYCKEDIGIEKMVSMIKEGFSETEMKDVELIIKECYDQLYSIKKKSEQALELVKEQIVEIKKNREYLKKFNKIYKKISRINGYFMEQPIYMLLDYYVTAVTTQAVSELYYFSGNENEDLIKTYNQSSVFFKAISDAVDFTKPLLESAMIELSLSKD